ncbi:MAG TPA: hypothetical protein VK726_13305 [Acetobacteraceae bacterium]|nr:hypothetical protein [Acetobacteraceae bacterium]
MTVLKLTRIGDPVGVILRKELRAKLGVARGTRSTRSTSPAVCA